MSKTKRLQTIDGESLMSLPLTPLNFVVDTLLSQGLHILAGSPKVGKSWLALWLSVMVAKGEPVWGMSVKQGTTLYLCLEDSVLRIQNRLFEITEDAPSSVHFCTECALIGQGLEEQVETFLTAHPDTVLVIIDTLQMVRPARDATYANDYRDLSALKRIADAHGIAILLIHHLRKETADDVFNRISGTTAISGAVDSSFTLVEERRGSGRAKLSCVGRDIEYRELMLERNGENVWELVSDSRTQPELLGDRIVYLLSELMSDRTEFIGTPTELSERIDPLGVERISPKKVSRQILQNLDALRKIGISAVVRRSNGKRLIELRRAESDDTQGVPAVDPVDPADALCGDLWAVSRWASKPPARQKKRRVGPLVTEGGVRVFGAGKSPQNRVPTEAQRQRVRWEEDKRQRERALPLAAKRGIRRPLGRRPASRLSGHRHSRRPPSACLRGAAPHPSSAQSPHCSEHLTDQVFRTTLPCASSPNETR